MESDKNKKSHGLKFKIFLSLFILVVGYLLYVQATHLIYGQTCFTPQTVSSDTRCLYILSGNVYQKGTKSKPHQGNSCGTDVTNIIPSFHGGDAARYLDPNFVGKICTSTPSPTPTRTPTPTIRPTNTTAPTPTNTPAVIPTNTPVVQPTNPTNCTTKATGDADCNGLYNLIDFEIWRKEFTGSLTTKNADFNKDNVVSIIDFEIWRKAAIH